MNGENNKDFEEILRAAAVLVVEIHLSGDARRMD